MRKFLAKHAATTTGTLSCFDRLLFKGHLPLGSPHAMEEFLSRRGVRFKDLKTFVLQLELNPSGLIAPECSTSSRRTMRGAP